MTETLAANLLAYCVQISCVAVLGAVVAATIRIDAAPVRYAFWRVLVVLCLALPLVQGRTESSMTTLPNVEDATPAPAGEPVVADAAGFTPSTSVEGPILIALVLAAGTGLRLAWLAVGLRRLRRLRHAGTGVPADLHEDLQETLATRAVLRAVTDIRQPVTFGVRWPVILLPATLADHPRDIQRCVVAHELVHVQRRDWAWMLVEEGVRAAFWFHPAMWWLISRVQLAREEVVDEVAVLVTGRRRTYVEALLAFADGNPLAPATAFARRRHLFRRMMLVSKEAAMSPARIVSAVAVMACVIAVGSWYTVTAFPLQDTPPLVILRDIAQATPGPIERTAKPITPENPVPRRILSAPPALPDEGGDVSANVTLVITIDAFGRVVESRPTGLTLRWEGGPGGTQANLTFSGTVMPSAVERFASQLPSDLAGTAQRVIAQLMQSATAATRQWLYDAPAEGPLAFRVSVVFGQDPSAAAGSATVNGLGAVRVGGGIRQPRQLRRVNPFYPEDAKAAGVSGVVILEVLIGTDGRVVSTRLLRSIPLLDQAAIDAVQQWEYTPTLLNGQAVPVLMTVTVNFTLSQ